MKTKVIVLGSKLTKTKDGSPIYLCYGDNNQQFWSQEKLEGGTAVQLTERKKGDKYVDRDGKDAEVQKDGFNLDFVIGSVSAVKSIKEAKLALVDMD